MELKEEIISTVTEFINGKIDAVIDNNPRMTVFAPHLKQGVNNFIKKNTHKIDDYLMFITDDKGKLQIGDIFEEGIKVLDSMPIMERRLLSMPILIGKGAIEVKIPQNFFTDLFFNSGGFKFTGADIMELKELLINKTTI